MKKRSILYFSIVCFIITSVIFICGCDCKNSGKNLVSPSNIAYDGTKITWDSVALAEHYTVQINNGEEKKVTTNSYTFNAGEKEFTVVVKAVLSKYEKSESVTFHPLATIQELFVSDTGEVSWNAVENADSYRISINEKILDTDITDTTYNTLNEGRNTIKVRPVKNGDNSYYSSWSTEKTINVLSKPSNIKYDEENGIISWSGVSNASAYSVVINGEELGETNNRSISYSAGKV